MTEQKKKRAEEALIAELRKESYLDEKDGVFTNTIYASYDDKITDKQAKEILLSDDPEMAFYEAVDARYEDYFLGIYEGEIVDRAVRKSYPADEEEENEIFVYLREYIWEHLTHEYPYDHYKGQIFNVDLMIDTGDANYDFSLNPSDMDYGKRIELDERASIVWLAKTQGYTKTDLEKILTKEDIDDQKGFLQTAWYEAANATSHMNCLTFLVKMSMQDLIEVNKLIRLQGPESDEECDADLRPDCGTMKLSRNVTVGFVDRFNGGGSCFGIQLEKDIELPIKYIHRCEPDVDKTMDYSVESIFGMYHSAWKNAVSEIKPPTADN